MVVSTILGKIDAITEMLLILVHRRFVAMMSCDCLEYDSAKRRLCRSIGLLLY